MNKKDRNRLLRLKKCIESIPLPHDGTGTKTASVAGFVHYQNDMREALPFIREVFNGMILGSIDTPENDIELGIDYENPDKGFKNLRTG